MPPPVTSRISLTARMVGGFAVFAIVIAVLLALLLSSLDTLTQANRNVQRTEQAISEAFAAQAAVVDMETGLRGYLVSPSATVLAPWLSGRTAAPARLDALEHTPGTTPQQTALVDRIGRRVREFVNGYGMPLVASARAGMTQTEKATVIRRGKAQIDAIRADFDRYVATESARAARYSRDAQRKSDRAQQTRLAGAAVLVLLVLLFGLVVARKITGPLRRIAGGARSLAHGDLAARVPEDGAGEVGEVGRAFNAMAGALQAGDAELRRLGEEHLALVEGVFAQTPVGLAFIDRDLRFVRVNAELARIDGIPVDEHFDRLVGEVFPTDIAHRLTAQVLGVLEGDGATTVTHTVDAHETGAGERVFEVTCYPVSAPGGGLIGVGAVVVETTARHNEAIDRERLLAQAQAAASRTERLQGATASLAAAVTPSDVLDVGLRQAAAAVDADGGVIATVEPDGTVRIMGDHGYPADRVDHWRQVRRGTRLPLTDAAREGVSVFIGSREELMERYPDMNETGSPFQSWAALPLVGRGRRLGAMIVAFSRPRTFGPETRGMMSAIAEQCAVALDRAVIFDRERSIASTLQRSLLPASLPEIDGLLLRARYRAAGEGYEVGGDFYDAVDIGDGRCVLAIGDVCGKGAAAAAVTGIARHALRAEATHVPDPAELLERLNIVMLRDSPDRFCTAATACATPESGGTRVSFALAGHHAGLLFPARGEPSILPGQGGTVLGVVPRIDAPAHDVLLEPGDIVVLHTDGLLDAHAPARQLQQEDVLRAAAGLHDADALLDRLLEFAAQGGGEPRDDIALLAVQAV